MPNTNSGDTSSSRASRQSARNTAHHNPPPMSPPPAQRQRIVQLPIDQNLINTRVMRTEEIRVKDLLNKNVEMEMSLNKTHVNLQILQIITPQAGNMGNAMTRYQRGNQQQRINFIWIILCRNNNELCYIMMTSDTDKRLFHRDLMLRDNGTITIGLYIRLLAPHPIERNMQGIPLIKSFFLLLQWNLQVLSITLLSIHILKVICLVLRC
jgi:hypothetical protein